MAAERNIVFLVLIGLGAGVYIISSAAEDNTLREYSERVVDYNEAHHESFLENAIRNRRASVNVHDLNKRPNDQGKEDNSSAGGQKAKRSTGQGINKEEPEHPISDNNQERFKRSSGQGINEEDADHNSSEADQERFKRSSGQGITNEDPEHPFSDKDQDRFKRSSGQGINEEDPEHISSNDDQERFKRSSGQGINEDSDASRKIKLMKSLLSEVDQAESVDDNKEHAEAHISKAMESWVSYEEQTDIINLMREESLEKLDQILSQFIEDKGEREKVLADFLSDGTTGLNLETTASLNNNQISRAKRNLYQPEYSAVDLQPHIGYLLLSSLKSDNDDHEKIIKLNKGVDVVLEIMNGMFSDDGLSIDLPNINKTFGHGVMAGTFQASKGHFTNPGSLHRTGDVAIFKKDGLVGLEVALGLQVLEAGYDNYDVNILKIHQNGKINVSIGQNSLKMKISLAYFPHCQLNVDYIELDQLGGIKVDISGLGAFQSMFNMLSKWLLDNFTPDFKNIVNKKLMEKAKKAVAKEDICKYFPF